MRVIVDTNVLFEGLTTSKGACGLIIDAWRAGLFVPCVSLALAYEYEDVLGRKLSSQRWQQIRLVLKSLLQQAEPVQIYFTWRPSSPDPGDEHLIDCAMNADAWIVTFNQRDFRFAQNALGLTVLTPDEMIVRLLNTT